MTDIIRKAEAALSEGGLVLNGPLDMSGKLAMCGTTKKPHGTEGRYIFHADFPQSITVINHHAGGQKQTIPLWQPGKWEAMTEAERKALQERIRQEKEEFIQRRERKLQEAKAQAQKIYAALPIAGDDNAYLQSKGVKAHGDLRQEKNGDLVIPVYDATGAICSLQFVSGSGDKRFLSVKLPEVYFSFIPAKDGSKTGTLRISEGYGTAASIHEATGDAVLIAFSCYNLENVAVFARSKYTDRNIVLCADNDKPTPDFPEFGGVGVFYARKAAQAVKASLAICPLIPGCDSSDFNDLHAAYGLERVRNELAKAIPVTSQNNNAWPEIIPFTSSVGSKIDASKLPEGVFRDFCVELAEATQTPLELCVGMALAVVATAAQRQYVVRVKPDYTQPVNLFIMCPLEPANRKSAVVQACMEPLKEWEHEQAEKVEPLIRQAASKRQTIQKAIDGLRTKAVKNAHDINQLQMEIEELEKDLPEIPHKPRLWCDSITVEQLAHLTAENGGSMAILSSEAGIFDILGGQYSNGIANLDLVLKGHEGESYRVDRRNSEAVIIEKAILTIGITPQAGALADRCKGLVFRYRGLDARFLYFVSESLLGRRKLEPAAMREETKRGFRDKIFSLLPDDVTNRPEPTELELSQEAYEVWGKFYREVEKRLAPGGEFESMKDWGGKLPGAVARIAGLFHILEHDRPHDAKISGETMRQAVYMGCLLSEHVKIAYDLMGVDEPTERAKAALAWIRNNRFMPFNARDCGRALQGRTALRLNRMEFVNEALGILTERGYIRKLEENRSGPGRKQSDLYEVNPAIREEAI